MSVYNFVIISLKLRCTVNFKQTHIPTARAGHNIRFILFFFHCKNRSPGYFIHASYTPPNHSCPRLDWIQVSLTFKSSKSLNHWSGKWSFNWGNLAKGLHLVNPQSIRKYMMLFIHQRFSVYQVFIFLCVSTQNSVADWCAALSGKNFHCTQIRFHQILTISRHDIKISDTDEHK